MIIREYEDKDNLGWVRCRVLSFLDSAYFDNILREKERYINPSVELVAEIDNTIVGILDIEYEAKKGDVCYYSNELGGVIWHLAVLPEYRNRGISTLLLDKSIELLKNRNIRKLEAWTRDDKWVNDWYKNRGFQWREKYLHVYAEGNECDEVTDSKIKKMYIINSFLHYTGENEAEIRKKFNRVHDCNLYELSL